MATDTVVVHFARELIAAMLGDDNPKTIKLATMGEPNPDGSYTPTFVVEEMDPPLPEPWTFDGYRRLYDDGKVTELWQARAVDLKNVEFEKGTGRAIANHKVGLGKTLVQARNNLLEVLG